MKIILLLAILLGLGGTKVTVKSTPSPTPVVVITATPTPTPSCIPELKPMIVQYQNNQLTEEELFSWGKVNCDKHTYSSLTWGVQVDSNSLKDLLNK